MFGCTQEAASSTKCIVTGGDAGCGLEGSPGRPILLQALAFEVSHHGVMQGP